MTSAKNANATLKPLVVDAMVLISAVIGEATPKIIQRLVSKVVFYAPEHAYEEAEQHLPTILTRRNASPNQINEVLKAFHQLRTIIVPISKQEYEHLQVKAVQRIPRAKPRHTKRPWALNHFPQNIINKIATPHSNKQINEHFYPNEQIILPRSAKWVTPEPGTYDKMN
jgi:hypothetical protein